MLEIITQSIKTKEEHRKLKDIATQDEETLWINTHLLQKVLLGAVGNHISYLGEERTREVITNSVKMPTIELVQYFFNIKIEIYKIALEKSTTDQEKNKIKELIQETIMRSQILVTCANANIEYLTSKRNTNLYQAITETVSKLKPKAPEKWPPDDQSQLQKIIDLEKKINNRPSGFSADALMNSDVSLCKNTSIFVSEICESRGLTPYIVRVSFKKGEKTSFHILNVLFEDNDKNKPIFIDGQNSVVSYSFAEYKAICEKHGLEITSCTADALISDGQNRNWDLVKFL